MRKVDQSKRWKEDIQQFSRGSMDLGLIYMAATQGIPKLSWVPKSNGTIRYTLPIRDWKSKVPRLVLETSPRFPF